MGVGFPKYDQDCNGYYVKTLAKWKLNIKLGAWESFCASVTSYSGTIFKILKNKILKNTDLLYIRQENTYIFDTQTNVPDTLVDEQYGFYSPTTFSLLYQ